MKCNNHVDKDRNQDENVDISSSEKVVQENIEGSERDDGIDEMIVNREERNGGNMGVE